MNSIWRCCNGTVASILHLVDYWLTQWLILSNSSRVLLNQRHIQSHFMLVGSQRIYKHLKRNCSGENMVSILNLVDYWLLLIQQIQSHIMLVGISEKWQDVAALKFRVLSDFVMHLRSLKDKITLGPISTISRDGNKFKVSKRGGEKARGGRRGFVCV